MTVREWAKSVRSGDIGDSLLTMVDLVDLTKHAKLEGDAMEGRRTNGTTSRTDSGICRRREHCLAGRNVWSGAQDHLQVDRAARCRRSGRVAGSQPGAAHAAATADSGDHRAGY